jgi:hypothetical protein
MIYPKAQKPYKRQEGRCLQGVVDNCWVENGVRSATDGEVGKTACNTHECHRRKADEKVAIVLYHIIKLVMLNISEFARQLVIRFKTFIPAPTDLFVCTVYKFASVHQSQSEQVIP